MSTVYGPSTVNRQRRSRAELGAIDDAIMQAVADDHPVTLRGVFYRVVSAGAVEKTELGYRLVGRQLLKLRRAGAIRYDWITDGTRWINKPDSFTGDEVETAVFKRLAVTEDQIYDLDLPTRPTKAADTRARGFDGGSVEVDAIPARQLREIVREAITQHIDPEALRLTQVAEESEREVLQRMIGGAA